MAKKDNKTTAANDIPKLEELPPVKDQKPIFDETGKEVKMVLWDGDVPNLHTLVIKGYRRAKVVDTARGKLQCWNVVLKPVGVKVDGGVIIEPEGGRYAHGADQAFYKAFAHFPYELPEERLLKAIFADDDEDADANVRKFWQLVVHAAAFRSMYNENRIAEEREYVSYKGGKKNG